MGAVKGDQGQTVSTTRNGAVRVEVWKLQQRVRITWLKREVAHPFGQPYLTVRRVRQGGVGYAVGLSDRGDTALVTIPEGWRLEVWGPEDTAPALEPEVDLQPAKGVGGGRRARVKGDELRLPGVG